MIALILSFIITFQLSTHSTDSVSEITTLNDSLLTEERETLNLSTLSGWEFSADDLDTPSEQLNWVKLGNPLSEDNPLLDSLWNDYGSYRLNFKIDSSFSLKQVFINIGYGLNVSAEVFLNGKSILKVGEPTTKKEDEVIFANYIGSGTFINLEPDQQYELIVKRSYHRSSLFKTFVNRAPITFHLPLIRFSSINANNASLEIVKYELLQISIIIIVLVALCFLQLLLYFKVENQKENLWLVLLMACLLTWALRNLLWLIPFQNFWLPFFLQSLENFVLPLFIALVPFVLHKLFDLKTSFIWKIFVGIGPLSSVLLLFDLGGIDPRWFFFPLILISLGGGLHTIYIANRKGVKDTLIPALSILYFPTIFTVYIILSLFGIYIYHILIIDMLLFLSIPIGLSYYQGKKFLRLHVEMDQLVDERTNELQYANSKLETSLSNLKATQDQLVHAEKMASLGELTAGIAHEIQNPLNFVNNFSEVSSELLEEMDEEIEKGDFEEVKFISKDIKSNLEKINHHGKRADAIVKGMLAHSRTGKGEKIETDINALADEYLRLSYHGLRAKDSSFNAEFKTDFDPNLPKINVIPQDIGRVLLNLINNAFQACTSTPLSVRSESDGPMVQISTKRTESGIQISVSDNGPGIPDNIKDKIFQPFFTTKPTGQGTGLGLSLSYDIVKAHGGTISVESSKTSTIFTLVLPISNENKEELK